LGTLGSANKSGLELEKSAWGGGRWRLSFLRAARKQTEQFEKSVLNLVYLSLLVLSHAPLSCLSCTLSIVCLQTEAFGYEPRLQLNLCRSSGVSWDREDDSEMERVSHN
jgi:hypothetical protein